MSATKQITITIQCNCGTWEQGSWSTVEIARKELKETGWTSKRGDLDYCPQCSAITEKYKKRSAPKKTKQPPNDWPGDVEMDMRTPPGSDKAKDQGCLCPRMDNEYGKGRGGCGAKFGWIMVETCPLHGVKK